MWDDDLSERIVNLRSEAEKTRLAEFLRRQGLSLDDVEYSVAWSDEERIVATGSLDGNVLKCIAVDEDYLSGGLSAKILTSLEREAFARGRPHLFLYTKPRNEEIFSSLGFYRIAGVPDKVVLLENRPDGIEEYLRELARDARDAFPGAEESGSRAGGSEGSAAVVVNCNPFTLGHRYLIEYAAARCETLHVFVLWEDKSSFPAAVRYRLVREGVRHLGNVVLHRGRDYVISAATFPAYFLKEPSEAAEIQARLDLEIFTRRIAPALGIKKRFAGEEPYCPVTAVYNAVMGELLPARGIELQVVPRSLAGGRPISASRVRELIRAGQLSAVEELVPASTYRFLASPEAESIIRRIQADSKRR